MQINKILFQLIQLGCEYANKQDIISINTVLYYFSNTMKINFFKKKLQIQGNLIVTKI